jgi:hypothetical protein
MAHLSSRKQLQRGSTAVEFALIALVFFTLLFAVIELARLMYVFNTLPDVTRRAASVAANTDFSRADAMNVVRQQAIFRSSPGALILIGDITEQSIRIDYLSVDRASDGSLSMVPIPAASLPGSPAENRRNCLVDPNSSTCIRMVRVRVCAPGNTDECDPIQYRTLISLIHLSLALPRSTTLAKAQSLGL